VPFRAALFSPPKGKNVQRPTSYPTNDGLDFTGINFPTPISQIEKIEKQNSHLAINVFGWENCRVIVHRNSDKNDNVPRINLMLIQKGEKMLYTYVKRLRALLYDQIKHNESKHICERCLQGYSIREDFLERHKPECKGANERPTKIEMSKEGENKISFKTTTSR